MSRLENKMKAGYFPTPTEVVKLIIGHLSPPKSGDYRWLDPCAGEGHALNLLWQHLNGETYGIELDTDRAWVARKLIHHVLPGDYAAQRLPTGDQAGISALFLNPPYDTDDTAGGRLELAFLRDTQDWLMPGGVLIYIIPQYRISAYVARRLATHFRDVKIYRFPDPDFEDFRQVVIFAIKRDQPVKDDQATLEIAMAQKGYLPVLPPTTDEPCHIPPRPEHPFYFRPAEYDPQEVLAEAQRSGVWHTKTWADLLTPHPHQTVQPLMPLRRGHIAMVLAAGLLDNMTVEQERTKLLVKGRLRKIQVDVTDQKDRENHIFRTREQFQAQIATLDLESGEITHLKQEQDLRAWLVKWQERLAARIVEVFKPVHQMTYEGLPHFDQIIATHSRFRRLPGRARTGLFEAQKQVTAALTRRFMAGHDFAVLQATMGTGKTTVALSLADVLKKYYAPHRPFPIAVVCPPHLVGKWLRETTEVIPLAHAMEVRRPSDLEAYVQGLHNLSNGTLSVAVISSEMLKLGSGWTPAVVRQPKHYKRLTSEFVNGRKVEKVERLDTFACPRCGQTIYQRDEKVRLLYPITDPEVFAKRRKKCDNPIQVWVGHPSGDGTRGHLETRECGEPLYQDWRGKWIEPQRDGFGDLLPLPEVRYPIAQYIHRRYPRFFELAVVDECFPADTPIATPRRPIPIRDLKAGDEVLSYKDGHIVTRRIVRTMHKASRGHLVRVTHTGGSFVCTPNHQIYVDGQYIRADQLQPGDQLTGLCTDVQRSQNTGEVIHGEDLPNLRPNVHGPEKNSPDMRPERLPRPAQAKGSRHHQELPRLRPGVYTAHLQHTGAAYLQSVMRSQVPETTRPCATITTQGADVANLPVLRQGVPVQAQVQGENTPFLQPVLCSQSQESSQSQAPRTSKAQNGTSTEAFLGAHEAKQSDEKTRNPSQGQCSTEGQGLGGESSWGPRGSHASTPASVAQDHGLASRVRNTYRQPEVARGNGGSGLPPVEDRCRVRWPVAQHEAAEEPRPNQGADVSPERLVGDAVLQPGNPGANRESPPPDHQYCVTTCLAVEHIDTDDEEVYNLEVEDTHCYFAVGVLVSNCHEMKGQSTDRGYAFGTLVRASKRSLAMTGTLFGGFATSLFYLLHRLDASLRSEFAWSDGQRFAGLYGVLERTVKHDGDHPDRDDYGHYSGLRRRYTRVIERPGISPALVTRLLDSTIFLTLEDLGFELPEYTEHPVVLPMIKSDGQGPDQAEVYRQLHDKLLAAARDDWSLMSEYLQTTLSWPNACWRDEETSLGIVPALPADRLYPKEEWLLNKCLEEKRRYRRVLLFVRQTATRDIQPRLAELLTKAGLRVVILRSGVSTRKREAWVNHRIREGLDVLICNPRLVQTGLDLVDFPTVVFYEPEYSIYLIQQASRRTWRLGQTHPVDVYFAVYDRTMEHRAVAHVGKKVAAAQLLYGDDVTGALVEQAGVGGSFLEDLAREVVANTEIPDLGELFVQKHQAVEDSGWLLGDNGPAIAEREIAAAPPVSLVEVIPIDPGQSVQLTLF